MNTDIPSNSDSDAPYETPDAETLNAGLVSLAALGLDEYASVAVTTSEVYDTFFEAPCLNAVEVPIRLTHGKVRKVQRSDGDNEEA